MMSEFGNQTGMDLRSVRELVLRHENGSPGRWAVGLRHHEWGFYGFCLNLLPLLHLPQNIALAHAAAIEFPPAVVAHAAVRAGAVALERALGQVSVTMSANHRAR